MRFSPSSFSSSLPPPFTPLRFHLSSKGEEKREMRPKNKMIRIKTRRKD